MENTVIVKGLSGGSSIDAFVKLGVSATRDGHFAKIAGASERRFPVEHEELASDGTKNSGESGFTKKSGDLQREAVVEGGSSGGSTRFMYSNMTARTSLDWIYKNERGSYSGPYTLVQLYEGMLSGFLPEDLPIYRQGSEDDPKFLKLLVGEYRELLDHVSSHSVTSDSVLDLGYSVGSLQQLDSFPQSGMQVNMNGGWHLGGCMSHYPSATPLGLMNLEVPVTLPFEGFEAQYQCMQSCAPPQSPSCGFSFYSSHLPLTNFCSSSPLVNPTQDPAISANRDLRMAKGFRGPLQGRIWPRRDVQPNSYRGPPTCHPALNGELPGTKPLLQLAGVPSTPNQMPSARGSVNCFQLGDQAWRELRWKYSGLHGSMEGPFGFLQLFQWFCSGHLYGSLQIYDIYACIGPVSLENLVAMGQSGALQSWENKVGRIKEESTKEEQAEVQPLVNMRKECFVKEDQAFIAAEKTKDGLACGEMRSLPSTACKEQESGLEGVSNTHGPAETADSLLGPPGFSCVRNSKVAPLPPKRHGGHYFSPFWQLPPVSGSSGLPGFEGSSTSPTHSPSLVLKEALVKERVAEVCFPPGLIHAAPLSPSKASDLPRVFPTSRCSESVETKKTEPVGCPTELHPQDTSIRTGDIPTLEEDFENFVPVGKLEDQGMVSDLGRLDSVPTNVKSVMRTKEVLIKGEPTRQEGLSSPQNRACDSRPHLKQKSKFKGLVSQNGALIELRPKAAKVLDGPSELRHKAKPASLKRHRGPSLQDDEDISGPKLKNHAKKGEGSQEGLPGQNVGEFIQKHQNFSDYPHDVQTGYPSKRQRKPVSSLSTYRHKTEVVGGLFSTLDQRNKYLESSEDQNPVKDTERFKEGMDSLHEKDTGPECRINVRERNNARAGLKKSRSPGEVDTCKRPSDLVTLYSSTDGGQVNCQQQVAITGPLGSAVSKNFSKTGNQFFCKHMAHDSQFTGRLESEMSSQDSVPSLPQKHKLGLISNNHVSKLSGNDQAIGQIVSKDDICSSFVSEKDSVPSFQQSSRFPESEGCARCSVDGWAWRNWARKGRLYGGSRTLTAGGSHKYGTDSGLDVNRRAVAQTWPSCGLQKHKPALVVNGRGKLYLPKVVYSNPHSARTNRVALRKLAAAVDGTDILKLSQLKARKKRLKFQRSNIHDWGLIAVDSIDPDDFIIEYVGELIRPKISDIREQHYEKMGMGSSYLFRIDDEYVVDATRRGGLARFINHSCDPNCYTKIISIEGQKKVVIYSKRQIQAGEELTYDYKFPLEEKKIPCCCRSARCRGFMN